MINDCNILIEIMIANIRQKLRMLVSYEHACLCAANVVVDKDLY